ncbi:uncharacterized protein PAC_17582 [Phialocephala subalpina]|uniref:Uncharacterized protein n=1 Tax=Phialocephala subalpina TaxID=576137 RepID=A0A1L7XRL5_9HELO|nr:uncharacterized protein PAC_17582 [Phialocephala subalpina]
MDCGKAKWKGAALEIVKNLEELDHASNLADAEIYITPDKYPGDCPPCAPSYQSTTPSYRQTQHSRPSARPSYQLNQSSSNRRAQGFHQPSHAASRPRQPARTEIYQPGHRNRAQLSRQPEPDHEPAFEAFLKWLEEQCPITVDAFAELLAKRGSTLEQFHKLWARTERERSSG